MATETIQGGRQPGRTQTLDELEDALSLISENGGSGEYETNEETTIERWLFPRFPGADEIGTCERHTGEHKEITTGAKKGQCKNWTVDSGNMYMSRTGVGPHDSDVETVAAWLDAPRTLVGGVLLLGEPGTGKTALVEAAVTYAKRELMTVVCTPDHTKDSLFLRFMGEGKGEGGSPFALGPIPYAAKHGLTLYCDEVMLLVDGLKPVLYSLADGRRFLPEGNVDGSPLEIHPDFRLILSSNPLVRGASLPEPLASRCATTTLTVETGEDLLLDLGLAEEVVAAWKALGVANLFRPQIRELRLADYWLNIDQSQAMSAFLPEHCPETDREAVRNTVMGYIGGDLRADGRLVVH